MSGDDPLWREEFSVHAAEERYVSRRQFGKFMVLASLGMFVGNLWIYAKSLLYRDRAYTELEVVKLSELPVGGAKLFRYPTERDPCVLVRTGDREWNAFSQTCTHLSCPVVYVRSLDRLECPCHRGAFSARDGSVIQGPPPRPLPRVLLSERAGVLYATGMTAGEASS